MSDATAGDLAAVLPLDSRGGLVFEPLHDSPLYLSAAATLAGVVPDGLVRVDPDDLERVTCEIAAAGLPLRVVTRSAWWVETRRTGSTRLLVHDPLCPLTPADTVSEALSASGKARRDDVSVAAVRPVTDTVKTADQNRITGTIDRSGLLVVSSPVVIAAGVLEQAVATDDEPPLVELARLVGWLRERGVVELVQAPSLARRVDDLSSLQLLECMDELSHHLRAARP